MQRTPVVSSNIASVGYDAAQLLLEVEFKGSGVYQYPGVSPEVFRQLVEAESVGSFFAKNIRGRYQGKKLVCDAPGPDGMKCRNALGHAGEHSADGVGWHGDYGAAAP